jgi:hypothetical protein
MATGPSYLVLVLKMGNRDSAYLSKQILPSLNVQSGAQTNFSRHAFTGVLKVLRAVCAGAMPGVLWGTVINDAGTKPTSTITCTQANAANDTVTFTFGGKTIVLTEAVDFVRGANDAACATNLAAAINAQATLKQLMTASVGTNVVTLTFKFPTVLGHAVTTTTSDATAFALVQFASGTSGAAQFFLRAFQSGMTP